MPDLAQYSLPALVLLLLVREVVAPLLRMLAAKHTPNGRRIPAAGDQAIEFWEIKQREAVAAVLEPIMLQQTKILEGLVQGQLAHRESLVRVEGLLAALKDALLARGKGDR